MVPTDCVSILVISFRLNLMFVIHHYRKIPRAVYHANLIIDCQLDSYIFYL